MGKDSRKKKQRREQREAAQRLAEEVGASKKKSAPEKPKPEVPPEPKTPTDKFDYIMLGILGLVSLILFMGNLDSQILWQDEAQNALISKTILTRGMPYGHDGTNHLSQELGAEYGKDYIWKWHTWLPFYLVAGTFKIFGPTTFSARLPFVLFGIATVLLTYLFTRELWKARCHAVMSSVLLMLCVPFILLSRQCRYYSAAAFFALLGLYAYLRILEGKRFAIPLFLAAGFLLFQTHYIYCVGLLGTVGLHVLLARRSQWKKVFLACIGVCILCLPWIIWLSSIKYGEQYGDSFLNVSKAMKQATSYTQQVFKYVMPALLLLTPLAVLVVRLIRKETLVSRDPDFWKGLIIPVLFLAITTVSLALTAPAPFFRYLAPMLPLIAVLAGLLVGITYRVHPAFGGLVLVACLAFQPLKDYLYELRHDYQGPLEAAVTYLNEVAQPEDTVAITYGDMPVKFYTGLKVVGGLTGEDLTPAQTAKWVILRKNAVCGKDVAVHNYLVQNLDFKKYRRITLDVPDIRFENRESPKDHKYRSVTEGPKLIIWERVADTKPTS